MPTSITARGLLPFGYGRTAMVLPSTWREALIDSLGGIPAGGGVLVVESLDQKHVFTLEIEPGALDIGPREAILPLHLAVNATGHAICEGCGQLRFAPTGGQRQQTTVELSAALGWQAGRLRRHHLIGHCLIGFQHAADLRLGQFVSSLERRSRERR